MPANVNDLVSYRKRVGEVLGVSDWLVITQDMINAFGSATLDPDPMHIDPEWSAEHSPFGGTIAFGFFTMSLLTHLLHNALKSTESGFGNKDAFGLNYGFDKLRLISPVPVGSRVRCKFTLADMTEKVPGEWVQVLDVVMEISGQEKPALVGQWLAYVVEEQGQTRIRDAAQKTAS